MAAVLASDDRHRFLSSLPRAQSRADFTREPRSYSTASTSQLCASYAPSSESYSDSEHSSAPSSPPTVQANFTDTSFASTPVSKLSISSDYDETLASETTADDPFSLPLLSQEKFLLDAGLHRADGSLEPPPSPRNEDYFSISPTADVDESRPRRKDPFEYVEHAEDDTAVVRKPSRQVDYLSHDWKEEDIWSSWRYVVSKRHEFANSRRLENASWRTWLKTKNNLKTISPEELNWLKDCDVTWLYGPLQSGSSCLHPTQTEPSSRTLSKSESLVNVNKKPILKKRSMSEIMLQRSISTSSLLKQAIAAVQAQETRNNVRPSLARAGTDCYVTYRLSLRDVSRGGDTSSVTQSTDSSGVSSPSIERKQIHFNEQVEQCIAVEVKGYDERDVDMDRGIDGSDLDEGVMMKRLRSKKRDPSSKRRVRKTAPADGRTIAMLPSTTLKYREDKPEPPETAMKHSTGFLRSPLLSPSSQETLQPSKQSTIFCFADDDDSWHDALITPPHDRFLSSSRLQRSPSATSLTEEPVGMRRTPSGMFMPCDDGDPSPGDGIFSQVIDTVNTARDIAHVIWNVGWRK